MLVVKSIESLRKFVREARRKRKSVGFVPTMGFLHEGHLSLMRQSVKDNDFTVVSIFVNPKQFSPHEDFKNYPRNKKNDEQLVKSAKVDIIFYPSVDDIYPSGYLTTVNVSELSEQLCGASRPEHFRGVATIVCKLLNIVTPDKLYLGQKDAQQALIIKKMVDDLNFPVKLKVMPIVREQDGLAMSSRNSYLTDQQRNEAGVLYRSLRDARQRILSGERNAASIIQRIRAAIKENSSGKIDYVRCVDARNLKEINRFSGRVLIALAVWFGRARLIDNVIVTVDER